MRMKKRPDAAPIGFKREGEQFVKTMKTETEEDQKEWSFWVEVAQEARNDEAQRRTGEVY